MPIDRKKVHLFETDDITPGVVVPVVTTIVSDYGRSSLITLNRSDDKTISALDITSVDKLPEHLQNQVWSEFL